MAKPKTVRPKILEFLAVEAGAKARAVEVIPAIARRLERSQNFRAKLPAAVAELQEVARNPKQTLKTLGEQGMLRDPQSSIAATEVPKGKKKSATLKAVEPLPPAPARYAVAAPEVNAAVIDLLKKKGLIEDGAMRLGNLRIEPRSGVALLSEALTYSAPTSAAGAGRRVNTRGGVFYELLMPFHEKVITEETRVACKEAEQIIRERGKTAKLSPAQIDAEVTAVRDTITARMAGMSRVATEGQALGTTADGVALMESGPVADNLWMIRQTGMRDLNGKLVADHFRTLVSFEKNSATLIPIGVGESKFVSGAGKIIPQVIETVARVSEGVTATNLPRMGKVEVQWGSEVVVVIQSEAAPPPGHFEDLAQKLAAEANTTRPLKATPITMVNKEGADNARELVKTVLDELKERKAQTKKPPKP